MTRFPEAMDALFRDRERVARFFSVATAFSSAETTDQVLKLVVRGARSLTCADRATLRLLESSRLVWAGRGGAGGTVTLQREIRVADRPYATLRVVTTRAGFTPEEEAAVDLLCLHAGIVIEGLSLRSHEHVLQQVRMAVGTLDGEAQSNGTVREVGDLRIDLMHHDVAVAGAAIHLTPSEFRLLELLTEEPGRAYTRKEIVARLWDSEHVGSSRIADAHVARLRRKLEEDPSHPERLQHVRGVGYRLVPLND